MKQSKQSKKVEIKNLVKIFDTKEGKVHAVNDVTLHVEAGEFVCLLGPSGCGKTTMLRMLAGFEIPTSGSVYIGDKDVGNVSPNKRDTAMVFQNYALFPHMNVFDNIAYGLKVQKISKLEIKKRVSHILHLMKMEDFAERIPSQMSGGQQQRVSLARALIMNSGVLLFDEPLSNLDAKLRLHMRDEIRKIQQEIGITSIYVTHDQEEAMALSDKIVIMKDGVIVQEGSPLEVYQKPNTAFVAKFIGRANILLTKIISKNTQETRFVLFGVEYVIKEHTSCMAGDSVHIVVRPEAMLLDAPKHTGKIVKSVFMGNSHEYEVSIDGEIVELSLSNPHGIEIKLMGEMLSFSLNIESMHILTRT